MIRNILGKDEELIHEYGSPQPKPRPKPKPKPPTRWWRESSLSICVVLWCRTT